MKRRAMGLMLGLVVAASCSKENTVNSGDEVTVLDVGQQCSGEDDLGCGEGAVCVLGYCRHGCTNDGECPQGALCIGDREPYGCTLPFELACSSSQPCDAPLTCGPDGKCRWACSEAADCPRNEHLCYEGACVSRVDPLNVGEECSEGDLAACGDGAVCLLGYCRSGCTTDAQCEQGALCIGSEEPFGCTLPDELACSVDDPCEEPLTCGIDGKCRWACSETPDCPRNEHICYEGACVSQVDPLNVGEECSENDLASCGDGAACLLGYCRQGCTTDGQCPQGALCVGSQPPYGCTLPAELACSASQSCPDPLVCGIDGKCRHPCLEDGDCPRNEHVCIAETCLGDEPVRTEAEQCSDASVPSHAIVSCMGYETVVSCNVQQFGTLEAPCGGICVMVPTTLRPEQPLQIGACILSDAPALYTNSCGVCAAQATACILELDCARCAANGTGCPDNTLFTDLVACVTSCATETPPSTGTETGTSTGTDTGT